uniref:PiggyBac transposable element-derived protein domain-containing protein n=1 Tax=Graphocephala atropunctata TaxID=36148 RepID=A0A1B6M557_9HEMI
MLESFRGRCSFRQYMPKKPAKYGLKMFALVDAKMMYTANLELYCGTQPDGPFSLDNRPHAVVKRLTAPIHDSGRNVTMDNWFSSVPIVNELVTQNKLTVVDSYTKKNKRELPQEIVNTRHRPVNSSLFAFGEQSMVVSYVPKKYRNVILISSMHDSDEIDDDAGDQTKPRIVTFYNSTKGGVDLVDSIKGEYTVARVSFRWPLRIFFSLLDIGAINAQIVLNGNTGEQLTRRILLKTLALDLFKTHMALRATSHGVQNDLRLKIRHHLGMDAETPRPQPVRNNERVKCGFCPKKNRYTTVRCATCVAPICGKHTVTLCAQCKTNNVEDGPDSD